MSTGGATYTARAVVSWTMGRYAGPWEERHLKRLRKEESLGCGLRITVLRVWNSRSYPDFLEGFQQAQTVTKVTRRKMPPVDKMM